MTSSSNHLFLREQIIKAKRTKDSDPLPKQTKKKKQRKNRKILSESANQETIREIITEMVF
ncbi:hypothetical protein C9439_00690 [archaeon SCG-AAA382B04]|nr:hypothetical protein C9439_00690 [archaeon SCG-AAA382B04]